VDVSIPENECLRELQADFETSLRSVAEREAKKIVSELGEKNQPLLAIKSMAFWRL